MTPTFRNDAAAADADAMTFDPTVPNPARMWNYWLGGKDNFPADRAAAEAVIAAFPVLPSITRATRQFLGAAVQRLAGQHGVRQFLDIGAGLPTADNTHEVAQRVAPDSRVVYVDNDPVVLAHAKALVTSTPEGKTDFILADLHDPETILEQAARTLDFSQPVAILLLAVLHFIAEGADPDAIVARLLAAAPAGSYLVLAHAGSDTPSAELDEAVRAYNERSPVQLVPRSREQIDRLLAGLEPVGPGVVSLSRWFGPGQLGGDGLDHLGYYGIMRKPG
jgi:O-methyltransferase involved in polyketide biosynthesis